MLRTYSRPSWRYPPSTDYNNHFNNVYDPFNPPAPNYPLVPPPPQSSTLPCIITLISPTTLCDIIRLHSRLIAAPCTSWPIRAIFDRLSPIHCCSNSSSLRWAIARPLLLKLPNFSLVRYCSNSPITHESIIPFYVLPALCSLPRP